LITTQLKALIAKDVINDSAYYEVINGIDTAVQRAVAEIQTGNANFPIRNSTKKGKKK
jgi:hypothetical protein